MKKIIVLIFCLTLIGCSNTKDITTYTNKLNELFNTSLESSDLIKVKYQIEQQIREIQGLSIKEDSKKDLITLYKQLSQTLEQLITAKNKKNVTMYNEIIKDYNLIVVKIQDLNKNINNK